MRPCLDQDRRLLGDGVELDPGAFGHHPLAEPEGEPKLDGQSG